MKTLGPFYGHCETSRRSVDSSSWHPPDDLPEEAQHEVRRALGQVVGVDVDDVAPDALGRGEGQREVLVPASLLRHPAS